MLNSNEEKEIIKYFFEHAGMGYYFLRTDAPFAIELPEDEQLKYIYESFYFYESNDFLARIYGYKRAEDIKGKKVKEIQAFSENFMRDFLRKGYKLFEVETYRVESDGKEKWYLNSCVGIVKDGFLFSIFGIQQDITERKWKERYPEEEKKIILNSVGELISFQDKDLRIVWANKSAGDSLNLEPESLIGKHCYELWHGREKVCEGCPVHRAILTGAKHEAEITTPDGRIWFIKGYPVKDKDGEIIGAIEVTLEITEKKRMEKSLERRNEILSVISFASQLFLSGESFEVIVNSILKRLGRALEVSRVYLFENKRDEKGKLFASIRYEWVAEGIEPQIDNPELQNFPWIEMGFERQVRMFERNEPVYGFVRDFPEAERKIFESQGIISLLTVPIFVDQEWWGFIGFDECLRERVWSEPEIEALKMLAVVIGSTIKRRKIENQLKESEEKFRLLAERAQDLIYRYEFFPERRFSFVSPSSTKITGYTPEEHYADPELGIKIVHPEDRHILEKIARGEQDYEKPILLRWIKKNGEILWTEQYNTPLFDKDGRLIAIEGIARDVTERKRMEERIKLQTRYFEGLFESSPLAIAIVDKDGKIIRINKGFEKLFGWREDEVRGEHIDDIVIEPERKEEALSLTVKATRGGIVLTEGTRIRKDGTRIMVSIIAHPIIIDHELIAQIGIYRDVTERYQMEQALIESETKFRTLTERSLVGVYLFQDGILLYVNPKFEEITGYSAEELIGKMGPKDLVHPEDWPLVEENIMKRLRGERRDVHYEFRGIRKNGEVIYVEVHSSLIIYKGKPAIIGTVMDITDRKLAEKAVRESEEKYRRLFEESKDGIFLSTPDGKIIDVNPAMVEIYGYSSREELMKIPVEKLYLNPEDRKKYREELEKKGYLKDYEIRGRRKGGTPVILLETSTAVRNEKGEVVLYMGIIRDVTAQKKLEEQLIQSQKMEVIGKLAGGIAHDFNNLLTVISGNAELLLKAIKKSSSTYKKIQQILESSHRASGMTKQLLTISKGGIFEPVVMNINTLIQELKEMLERVIGEDVEFEFSPDPMLKNIKADKTYIQQILMNLVVNAREAMPNGGKLQIKTQNVVFDEERSLLYPGIKPGEFVQISVTDTGIGIPSEILPKIFDPFFTTKPEGTGLGLSTVYGIVKQLGGHVTVYSEVGKGTTFNIYIPACSEKEIEEREEEFKTEKMPAGNETILVVEDEPGILELLISVLESLGYRVIPASNKEDVIKKLKNYKEKIHLLLTDVVLPGISGPEIAKELVQRYPDLKVLFMSGFPQDKIPLSEILSGRVNFIAKPFTPSLITRKIREILDKPLQ